MADVLIVASSILIRPPSFGAGKLRSGGLRMVLGGGFGRGGELSNVLPPNINLVN